MKAKHQAYLDANANLILTYEIAVQGAGVDVRGSWQDAATEGECAARNWLQIFTVTGFLAKQAFNLGGEEGTALLTGAPMHLRFDTTPEILVETPQRYRQGLGPHLLPVMQDPHLTFNADLWRNRASGMHFLQTPAEGDDGMCLAYCGLAAISLLQIEAERGPQQAAHLQEAVDRMALFESQYGLDLDDPQAMGLLPEIVLEEMTSDGVAPPSPDYD